jgi:hypothetical protein
MIPAENSDDETYASMVTPKKHDYIGLLSEA